MEEAVPSSVPDIEGQSKVCPLAMDQLSLLEEDETVEPLTPCRMQFILHWTDQDGRHHRQECDDWETVTAFNRFDREYGQNIAIQYIKEKYESQYFKAGLVLGFSTHSRRNVEFGTKNQWLLVGLIRLDEDHQTSLF